MVKLKKLSAFTRRIGGSSFAGALGRFWPLFMVVLCFLGLNLWFTSDAQIIEKRGVIGGPDEPALDLGINSSEATLSALSPAVIKDISDPLLSSDDVIGFVILDEATLENIPEGGSAKRDHLITYKIAKGDTLTKIADHFGISLETILWANPELRNRAHLKAGRELIILPVSGVLYKTVEGDTLLSISANFGVSPDALIAVNRLTNFGELPSGNNIIVPGGKPQKNLEASRASSHLADLGNYFGFPAPKNSWNWGKLHPTNAVDIANACGTPIYAAADGVVTEVGDSNDYNTGSGGYVKLEHPNNTQTLYAHTSKNLVEVGNLVNRGQEIAEIGKTGKVNGPTGCHVHFEVRGAKNPFAK